MSSEMSEESLSLKQENSVLRMQIVQTQEDFYILQDTIESIKIMMKKNVRLLEDQLANERALRQLAEQRLIFIEDKGVFMEENTDAVVQYLKTKCIQKNDDIALLKIGVGDTSAFKKRFTEEGIPTEGKSNVEVILMAREQQLERLAAQLDCLHHHSLKQTEETQGYITQLERTHARTAVIQKALWKERREKEDLQSRITHFDRAVLYKKSLSSSSVPVMVAIPDRKSIRESAFLIPPQEFLADLKADIDGMIEDFRGHMSRAAHSEWQPTISVTQSFTRSPGVHDISNCSDDIGHGETSSTQEDAANPTVSVEGCSVTTDTGDVQISRDSLSSIKKNDSPRSFAASANESKALKSQSGFRSYNYQPTNMATRRSISSLASDPIVYSNSPHNITCHSNMSYSRVTSAPAQTQTLKISSPRKSIQPERRLHGSLNTP